MGLFGVGGLKNAFNVGQLLLQDIVARSISLTQTTGNTAVQLVTGARLKLGTGTTDYLTSDGASTISAGGVLSGTCLSARDNTGAGGNVLNVGTVGTASLLVTTSAQVQIVNGAVLQYSGALTNTTAGNSTGAPGNATLNTPTGRSAIAAAAASVTITNSLVSATSIVLVALQTADATLNTIRTIIPGAGSFVVTGNAAATGNTNIGWVVFN